MSLKFRHKTNGREYSVKQYENGFHLVIPVKSEDDFRHFMQIAHAARMVPEGETQANVISFDSVEEI